MRCKQVREKLAEYELGGLDEAEAAAVAEHLAECAECQAELAALRRTGELMAPVEPASPPRDLWQGVKTRMRPRRATAWDALVMRWRPALAAGIALLVLASGLAWLSLRGPAVQPSLELLASEYQEQQIMAQWGQPLADDAALGIMFVSLENAEGGRR